MSIKTKTKKKINIDGKDVKIDVDVYKVMQNLSEALKSHEVALLTWVHKIYNTKKRHSDDEKGLYNYCMMIPDASNIINRMRLIDEENIKRANDESSDQAGDAEGNGSSDTEK